jgi:hypothetical protein
MFTFKNWKKFYNLLCETFSKLPYMYFLYFSLLHSWQTAIFWDQCMRWPPIYTPCARDIWWTLDFASAFLYPGVNSRAELVPSPRAYTWNGAVGSGIIYIKIFETNVVLTYVYSEHSTDKIFLALLYHIIQR